MISDSEIVSNAVEEFNILFKAKRHNGILPQRLQYLLLDGSMFRLMRKSRLLSQTFFLPLHITGIAGGMFMLKLVF